MRFAARSHSAPPLCELPRVSSQEGAAWVQIESPSVRGLTVGDAGSRDAPAMEIVIFCFVMLGAVIYGYYTVNGSGIAEHPHGGAYSDAPGAYGPGSASGRDERVSISNWSRGTR